MKLKDLIDSIYAKGGNMNSEIEIEFNLSVRGSGTSTYFLTKVESVGTNSERNTAYLKIRDIAVYKGKALNIIANILLIIGILSAVVERLIC